MDLLFLYTTSYGFDAFLGGILIPSLFLWPLYIIGIILILIGSLKIRKFKESEIIEKERNDYIWKKYKINSRII